MDFQTDIVKELAVLKESGSYKKALRTLMMCCGVTAFAAGDPIQVVVRSKQLAPPQGKANKG